MPRRRRNTGAKTVIRNFGLMWSRDAVYWNSVSRNGILFGRSQKREINFRDQIGVYVLYDETRRPIYVGQTGKGDDRLFKRLKDHTRNRLEFRWLYFSWFGLLSVNKDGTLSRWDNADKRVSGTIESMLNEIEGVLIAAAEPPSNKQGGKFKGITRFKQVRDERAEGVSNRVLYDFLSDELGKMRATIKKTRPKILKKKKGK